nr:hornerin-like [Caretta caretta]
MAQVGADHREATHSKLTHGSQGGRESREQTDPLQRGNREWTDPWLTGGEGRRSRLTHCKGRAGSGLTHGSQEGRQSRLTHCKGGAGSGLTHGSQEGRQSRLTHCKGGAGSGLTHDSQEGRGGEAEQTDPLQRGSREWTDSWLTGGEGRRSRLTHCKRGAGSGLTHGSQEGRQSRLTHCKGGAGSGLTHGSQEGRQSRLTHCKGGAGSELTHGSQEGRRSRLTHCKRGAGSGLTHGSQEGRRSRLTHCKRGAGSGLTHGSQEGRQSRLTHCKGGAGSGLTHDSQEGRGGEAEQTDPLQRGSREWTDSWLTGGEGRRSRLTHCKRGAGSGLTHGSQEGRQSRRPMGDPSAKCKRRLKQSAASPGVRASSVQNEQLEAESRRLSGWNKKKQVSLGLRPPAVGTGPDPARCHDLGRVTTEGVGGTQPSPHMCIWTAAWKDLHSSRGASLVPMAETRR